MNIPLIRPYNTVILANGIFPTHPVALSFLHDAAHLICCDGATEHLLKYGLEPHHIVGDLDSLSSEIQERYRDCLHHDPDQDTNDLTKAVHFCSAQQWMNITILGATGKREDHTMANISLLAVYADTINIQMVTDYGVFVHISESSGFESSPGQQVSVFSLTPTTIFTFYGLKYKLDRQALSSWWQGTLNEACGNEFSINLDEGKALVFREHLMYS